MRRIKVSCIFLGLTIACVSALVFNFGASPSVGAAAISGTVKGEAGKALDGVLVRLINADRHTSVSVITQGGGRYYADSLFPGRYEIRAERKGFEPTVKENVKVDSRASVDLLLRKQDTRVAHLSTRDVYDRFPEDPDKLLMVDTCLRCHSMLDIVTKRKDRDGWQKTIAIMYARRHGNTDESGFEVSNGTQADGVRKRSASEDINRLVNYFSKYFDTNQPVPPAFFTEPEPPVEAAKVLIREYGIPDQGRPEVAVPSLNSAAIFPHNITVTPDGLVWFAMYKANKIGSLDPQTGQFRVYPVPTKGSVPHGITYAKDGSIWFTEARGSKVGHLNRETGAIQEIAMNSGGNTIAKDSKGNMYVSMGGTNQVGKVNTQTGETMTYDLPTPHSQPYGIIVDHKDQVWWCELGADSVGKLDPVTGKITEYPTPTKLSGPRRLAVDKAGSIWFTEWRSSKLAKLDPNSGRIIEFDLPTPHSEPYEVGVDSEDTVWVAGYLSNTLSRFDAAKRTFVEYPIPTPRGEIRKMAADPKQGIWFAESHTDTIGQIVVKR